MKSPGNGDRAQERGFTLVELLVVLAILGLIVGAVFSQINVAQQRSYTEQVRLDDFQEARDFVDQFFRDINQIGYPNSRMIDTTASWSPPLAASSYAYAPYINDNRLAMGLVKIDNNEIRFEGDADGNGTVESIIYAVNGSGSCTACLQRSQADKVTGDPLSSPPQNTNWGTEVNDVVNTNPIFTYYDTSGNQIISLPADYTTTAGAQTLASVKTIKIRLTIQNNLVTDQQTHQPIQTNFEGEVSLNNCSMAVTGQPPMSCR